MARRDKDDDDDDQPKTPSDAYVGLLAIALVALLAAGVLLYLDFDLQEQGKPAPSEIAVRLADTGLNKPAPPGAAQGGG